MVEPVDDGVEFGFPLGDGLAEGGDFGVEGEDAVAEGGFGGGAEGEQELEEAFGVEGFGDVEVAEGVTPLGGDEGGCPGGRRGGEPRGRRCGGRVRRRYWRRRGTRRVGVGRRARRGIHSWSSYKGASSRHGSSRLDRVLIFSNSRSSCSNSFLMCSACAAAIGGGKDSPISEDSFPIPMFAGNL